MKVRSIYKSFESVFPGFEKIVLRPIFNFMRALPIFARWHHETYSQWGEDVMLKFIFRKGNGTYVDVGSGYPTWGNNTYLFYKRGWKGVLVDPISTNIRLSKLLRRRDVSICSAVGEFAGEITIYQFDPSEYTTTQREVYENLLKNENVIFRGEKQVGMTTLREIFTRINIEKPLILSVDTEGYEIQVLRGNDWVRFKPDVICVEEWVNPVHNRTEIRDYLENRGYKLVMYNGLSAVYVLEG